MSTLDEFPVGMEASRSTRITDELIDRFVALSGDDSAIHVDPTFAARHGFRDRVAHGQLLGALVSGVIGTALPGKAGVLQEISLSFHRPAYPDDEVAVTVRVAEHHQSVAALTCKIEVRNAAGELLVRGKFRSGLVEER